MPTSTHHEKQGDELVIHRTINCILTKGGQQAAADQAARVNLNRGYKCPYNTSYQALGDFVNVVTVMESVKQNIRNSTKGMETETEKTIQSIKRNKNPLFMGPKPERALKIIQGPENLEVSYKDKSKKGIDFSEDRIDL